MLSMRLLKHNNYTQRDSTVTDTDNGKGSNHRCKEISQAQLPMYIASKCCQCVALASPMHWFVLIRAEFIVEKIPILCQASGYKIMKQNNP